MLECAAISARSDATGAQHACMHMNLHMLTPTNVGLHATDVGSVVGLLPGHHVMRVGGFHAWVALAKIVVIAPCSHGVPRATEEVVEAFFNSRRVLIPRLFVQMWVLRVIFDSTDHTEVCPLTR